MGEKGREIDRERERKRVRETYTEKEGKMLREGKRER